jgi:murein DD-endopeptidase MepM/ murein hydrolase activator NlpD
MKALHLTWLAHDGAPKTARIPLWAVLAPFVLFSCVVAMLAVLWNGPWSPGRLREGLEQLERENMRMDRELRTARNGLERARTSVRMPEKDRAALRDLAGLPRTGEPQAEEDPGSGAVDVGLMLRKARSIRTGYDAIMDWFQRHPGETGHLPTIRPIRADRILVENFGTALDPFTGQTIEYPGLSWSVPVGTPLWATGAGTVVAVGNHARWGRYVEIRHDSRCLTLYGHLSRVDVKEGETVVRGQVLGLAGESGKTTAPQVAYAVFVDGEPIDPSTFLLPEGVDAAK